MGTDREDRAAVAIYNLMWRVCNSRQVQIEVSNPKVADAAIHFVRDIGKLDDHQGSQISVNKRIAGLAFWIRRIKPITFACKVNDDTEIQDINEQVAIWISSLLMLHYCDSGKASKMLRGSNVPGKTDEFRKYISAHWSVDGYFNYSTLVYAMRYRNFSPHHIAIILDGITTGFVLKHRHII